MKILAIGDPHGKLPKNLRNIDKNIDLVLITGDIGKADFARKRSFENFERRKKGLPKKEFTPKESKKVHNEIHNSTISILKTFSKIAPTYTIQGNMGIPTMKETKQHIKQSKTNLPCTRKKLEAMKDIYLIKNHMRNINGLKIGFLEYFVDNSWIKEFQEKDKKRIKDAKKETKKIRKILNWFGKYDLDILVCHQPPYKILDKVNFPSAPKSWQGKHAGSKIILDYINKYHPEYVLCGHIHEAKGEKKIGKTTIYNLGCCGDYKIIEI
jgi:Icc-related predicted phosphoesterase